MSLQPKGTPMSVMRNPAARKAPAFEYRSLLAATVCLFLVKEVATRLVPRRFRRAAGSRGTIFGSARAAADRLVPLVFMG